MTTPTAQEIFEREGFLIYCSTDKHIQGAVVTNGNPEAIVPVGTKLVVIAFCVGPP
jgi:hypothetical protein